MGWFCAAWFIMVVSSLLLLWMNICKAVDISIQIGDLAEVDTKRALNFMSGITRDKSKWWRLSNSTFHPEAFLRFMVLGAPPENVIPNSSWGLQEKEAANSKGFLVGTRDASLAQFSSEKSIQELGKLHITAWMLGFSCVNSSLCENSVAPMAIVYREEAACLEFTTVWNKLATGVVTNTITANLINVTKEEQTVELRQVEGKLHLKVTKGMQTCTSTSMVAVRSSLDATYNLGPYACYRIDNDRFKHITGKDLLLVLGMQDSNDTAGALDPQLGNQYPGVEQNDFTPLPQFAGTGKGNCIIKDWLQKYKSVSVSECQAQGSPSLLVYIVPAAADSGLINLPFYAVCVDSTSKTCLKIPTYDNSDCDDKILGAFNDSIFNKDPMSIDVMMNANGHYYMWGKNNYNLTETNLCEMGVDLNGGSLQEDFDNNNPTEGVDNETLGMMFTALKDRYAQAHSDAFQLQNGPSADFTSTAIALLSTAIAILAATVPFTNFLLRLLIEFCGGLSSYRYWKLVLIFVVNEVIAILSNSVVITEVISEKERENEFKTWALIAEPMLVNAKGLQLQALYVVQGKSVYTSKLLKISWILGSIVVLLVGVMTLYTCKNVLKKLTIIKKKKKESPIPFLDDFKALEMGQADYIELLHAPDVDNNSSLRSSSLEMTPNDHDTTDTSTKTNLKFKTIANIVYTLQESLKDHRL